ncbi:alpha/beta fold hydrolase [Mycobacteroides chelonae]|uniref:alpha/beta fold hydrolase n=1 Tax=Mycobacteroides chelonae TaxID=1774 RepID=UPI0008A94F94|nr:alpha/beta hydrolase [Mycobacteroides chelonae]OHU62809.1 alpha/beta hydrolase [Mycobacteroides chelonae]
MPIFESSAGPIHYRDDGDGPAIVFVHGLFVTSTMWRKVTEPLSQRFRCIAPDLPLGAHATPMNASANLTPRSVAGLIRELIGSLGLDNVTIVATDTGGAITQLLLADGCDRIGRVVLTPCDSFDNFLPMSIRVFQYWARIPGTDFVLRPFRLKIAQRALGNTLAKHSIPEDVLGEWVRPLLQNKTVRRDVRAFLRGIDYHDTLAAAETLRTFDKPVLLLWPRKLPFFPFAHAQRWVQLLPDARLVEVPDSYTFVSEDQPELMVKEIEAFVPQRV